MQGTATHLVDRVLPRVPVGALSARARLEAIEVRVRALLKRRLEALREDARLPARPQDALDSRLERKPPRLAHSF
jgi:hypothetical protein